MPFPRRFLVRIHLDLFQIARFARPYQLYPDELRVVEKMILVSEDRRFFRHNGLDYIAVVRELIKIISLRKHGGASTIDMQFVRVATGYYERAMARKLYEMLLAILLQFKYSKIEILRNYLDSAFFGSHIRGIQQASKVMFNKHPDFLSTEESSIIAAMLIYPRPTTPTSAWVEKILKRSNYIISLYPRFKERFEKLPSWDAI